MSEERKKLDRLAIEAQEERFEKALYERRESLNLEEAIKKSDERIHDFWSYASKPLYEFFQMLAESDLDFTEIGSVIYRVTKTLAEFLPPARVYGILFSVVNDVHFEVMHFNAHPSIIIGGFPLSENQNDPAKPSRTYVT
ncbi:MAG: hypothetical protein AM325_016025 [Candidatus Thorarchaeota archaeon SMTZ1-45]|nr:MAG: hypothetical protein AM325_16825 [Candidatus Thorarchaeota archaeon SMTZ1-45]